MAMVHVGILAPPELAEAFRELAARDERTVSQELRRLMKQRVNEAHKDDEPRGGGSNVTTSADEEPTGARL